MWLQLANKSYKIKPMDHFVGISIKKVACAPNVNLVCMISDRGILMTKGKNNVFGGIHKPCAPFLEIFYPPPLPP